MSLFRAGYWRQVGFGRSSEPGDSLLPDPRTLVDSALDPDVKRRILRYLKAGRVYAYAMGYSYCRFYCGIPDHMMGSRELTDGVWLWPEGYAHYVEAHSVRLPPELMSHLQRRDFEPPSDAEFAELYDPKDDEVHLKAVALYERLRKGWYDRNC